MSDTTDAGEENNYSSTNPSDVSSDDAGEMGNDPSTNPSEEGTTDQKISRRQAAAQKAADLEAEVAELREVVKPIQQEKLFKEKAKELGLETSEINREAFDSEFKALKADGLSTERATATALKIVGAGSLKQANEEATRESGRTNTQLPPSGTPPSKSVYKQDELASLDQPEYDRIMNLHDEGKVRILV